MNTRPSVYRMRPALITVFLALVVGMAWATPAGAYDWRIKSMLVNSAPRITGEKLTVAEGSTLSIECSWSRSGSPSDETSGQAKINHRISEKGMWGTTWVIKSIKLSPSMSSGNISGQWVAQGIGLHQILCEIGFTGKDPLYKAKEPNYSDDLQYVIVDVAPVKKVEEGKWPTAPIIVTPGQNQKVSGGNIVVKPNNPSLSHCADGGYISLDWQYLDTSTSTWKRITKLSSPWKCVPEGSTKDISYLKPGLYKVSAKETNGKHNFASDWSAWVTFEVVGAK